MAQIPKFEEASPKQVLESKFIHSLAVKVLVNLRALREMSAILQEPDASEEIAEQVFPVLGACVKATSAMVEEALGYVVFTEKLLPETMMAMAQEFYSDVLKATEPTGLEAKEYKKMWEDVHKAIGRIEKAQAIMSTGFDHD